MRIGNCKPAVKIIDIYFEEFGISDVTKHQIMDRRNQNSETPTFQLFNILCTRKSTFTLRKLNQAFIDSEIDCGGIIGDATVLVIKTHINNAVNKQLPLF